MEPFQEQRRPPVWVGVGPEMLSPVGYDYILHEFSSDVNCVFNTVIAPSEQWISSPYFIVITPMTCVHPALGDQSAQTSSNTGHTYLASIPPKDNR